MGAMVALARDLGIHRLQANCHSGHRRSMRVLENCGFTGEGLLNPGELADCYWSFHEPRYNRSVTVAAQ